MFSGHASALRTPGAMRWDDVSVPYKYGTISGLRRRPYICIDRGRVGFLFVFVVLCVVCCVMGVAYFECYVRRVFSTFVPAAQTYPSQRPVLR